MKTTTLAAATIYNLAAGLRAGSQRQPMRIGNQSRGDYAVLLTETMTVNPSLGICLPWSRRLGRAAFSHLYFPRMRVMHRPPGWPRGADSAV